MNTEMRKRFKRFWAYDMCNQSAFNEVEDWVEQEIKDAVMRERAATVYLIESFEIIAMKTEDEKIAQALTDITYPMIKEKLIKIIGSRPI